MKRTLLEPTIENLLKILSKRMESFNGQSRRSYRKAFSSLQIYLLTNYPASYKVNNTLLQNWLIFLALQGLTRNTVSFYLDKISSLYSKTAHNLTDYKTLDFKDLKNTLKNLTPTSVVIPIIKDIAEKFHALSKRYRNTKPSNDPIGDLLMEVIKHAVFDLDSILEAFPNLGNTIIDDYFSEETEERKKDWDITRKKELLGSILTDYLNQQGFRQEDNIESTLRLIWSCLALKAHINGNEVRNVVQNVPKSLEILQIYNETKNESNNNHKLILQKTFNSALGEQPNWFAMRLRPKVNYDRLLQRFASISPDCKLPQLFYPHEEIAKKTGRKIVWKEKPVIRDIVFFKIPKSEIYPLFSQIYDLAWCYKTPGGNAGAYAPIPDRAMEDFISALDFLSPDFEVAPGGTMELKPGDEVIIVNGKYTEERGKINKKPSFDQDGNKIYRVTLLHNSGRWDIGVDARLLKKA